jgi:predicted transcriptional regulator
MPTRPVVVRLPAPLADDLETVAWVERRHQSDIVRDAVTAYLTRRGHQAPGVAS